MTDTHAYPRIWQALVMMLCLAGLQIVMGVAGGLLAILLCGLEQNVAVTAATALANLIAFALVCGWGLWRTRTRLRTLLPVSSFRLPLLLALVPLALGLHILLLDLDNLLRHLCPPPAFLQDLFKALRSAGGVSFVALILLPALAEEVLFRGVMLRGFLRLYSVRTAVLVSALLFALIHVNPYQMPLSFVLGLVTAWLFIRTRSLWPCILLHGLNNLLALYAGMLGLDIPGYDRPSPVAAFQPLWFDLLGAVLLAVGLAAAMLFLRAAPERREPA
ncbi:MAG: CPBP family intramembrane metalloprotease [Kiritimatiellae bacterium]|nr:CPBP family intramembrane metalloprotease [Kiritimatiellia bacterium]